MSQILNYARAVLQSSDDDEKKKWSDYNGDNFEMCDADPFANKNYPYKINDLAIEPNIKLNDRDDEKNLSLYSYTTCEDDDRTIIKKTRGVIFQGNKLIVKSFNYVPEYTLENNKEWSEKNIYYPAYEGTIIRVFHIDESNESGSPSSGWHISTHRRLNAFKSKWSSKMSFGEIFHNCIGENVEEFFNTLDKNHTYIYLLLSTSENRIVSNVNENCNALYIGKFNSSYDFVHPTVEDGGIIPIPERLSFTSTEEMNDWIKNVDYKQYQGLICFQKDGTQYKILNDEYKKLFEVRGNEPSIKYRYLQIINDDEQVNLLRELYPDNSKWFDFYKKILEETCEDILGAYKARFLENNYISIPPQEYKILMEAKGEDNLTLENVQNIIFKQNPSVLNKIIKQRYIIKPFDTYYRVDGKEFFYWMRDNNNTPNK